MKAYGENNVLHLPIEGDTQTEEPEGENTQSWGVWQAHRDGEGQSP